MPQAKSISAAQGASQWISGDGAVNANMNSEAGMIIAAMNAGNNLALAGMGMRCAIAVCCRRRKRRSARKLSELRH